ncbi:MAG: sulfite exporter TauE/SafE family protein [Promethearchaeota archaeon]
MMGLVVGIFAALSGTGGGTLNVPIFEALIGLPIDIAQGTSSFVIFINSFSVTSAYSRQKRIDYKIGLMLVVFSAIAAVFGALSSGWIASIKMEGVDVGKQILRFIFYILILVVGFKMLIKKKKDMKKKDAFTNNNFDDNFIMNRKIIDSDGKCFEHVIHLRKVAPLSFLAGFVSGFFGIGGGIVQMPVLVQACEMSVHVAVATSGFMIMFNSLTSMITRAALNSIDFVTGMLYTIGSVIGAQFGARLAKGTPSKRLKLIISIILIALSLYKIATMSLNI